MVKQDISHETVISLMQRLMFHVEHRLMFSKTIVSRETRITAKDRLRF